ncbi:MAG: OmpA family protein [Proteobacteria bacterium]|nr:OmpA family protein [Pseudomonadota bacterium]
MQFEDSPLVLYAAGDREELGAVVHRRITTHLAMSGTIAKRWRIGGSLPLHGQWGSEVPDLAADGFGVGDLRIDGSFWLGRSTIGDFTAHLGFALPFGRRNAWMGDRGPRTEVGVAYATGVRRTEIHADVALDARGAWHESSGIYDRGSALLISGGVRAPIVRDKLHAFGVLYTRWGGGIFVGRGNDFVLSALAGAKYKPIKTLDVDLGIGRGVTPGVGTTDIRVLAQVSWHHTPKPPEPEPEIEIIVQREDIEEPPPPPPPPEPTEPPPAEIVGEQVIVTAPILFFVNTADLKPESTEAMEAIAELMADDPQIGHLVIEGHASAEGTYEYNYDLSARRARAIHEALMEQGVHKTRISYRGMGEVEPIVEGEDEDALAANRRVEFHIINRRTPGDGQLEHAESSPLPWSGEDVDTPRPEWSEEVLKKYEEEQAKIQKALGPVIEDDTDDQFAFDDPEMSGPIRVQLPPEARKPQPEVSKPVPVEPAPEPAPTPEPETPPAPETSAPTEPTPPVEPETPAQSGPEPDSTASTPTVTKPAPEDAVADVDPTPVVVKPAPSATSVDPYTLKVYAKFVPPFMAQADLLRDAGKLPGTHYSLALDAVLDAEGRLVSVKAAKTSGVEALDGAAIRAFFQAQPFAIPPASRLENGQVKIHNIRLEVEGSGVDDLAVPASERVDDMLDRDGGGQ